MRAGDGRIIVLALLVFATVALMFSTLGNESEKPNDQLYSITGTLDRWEGHKYPFSNLYMIHFTDGRVFATKIPAYADDAFSQGLTITFVYILDYDGQPKVVRYTLHTTPPVTYYGHDSKWRNVDYSKVKVQE
jgi:hypothetical protein